MDLKYYTLEQASKRLDCDESDLLYQIENDRLFPQLLVRDRRVIIVDSVEAKLIARGTCTYSGLVTIPNDLIKKFVRYDTIISTGVNTLKEPSKIESWNSDCCYISECYKSSRKIHKWESGTEESAKNQKMLKYIDFFYEEREPIFDEYEQGKTSIKVHKTDVKLKKTVSLEEIDLSKIPEYFYEITSSASYHKKDLVIPHRELLQFSNNISTNLSTSTRRRTAFSNLLIEILKREPNISANAVYRILKNESNSAERHYDTQEILLKVNDDYIFWINAKGKHSKNSVHTLDSTLSEIKSKLLNSNGE